MKHLAFAGMLAVLLIAVALPSAQAISLEYYGIEDTITDGLEVKHKITLQFDTPLSHLDYRLGFPVTNLTVKHNFDAASCTVTEGATGSDIVCELVGMTAEKNQLTLFFNSPKQVQESGGVYSYTANYGISLPVANAFTLIRLPQNGRLATDVANLSYSPQSGKMLTDGKHIMVYWNAANLTTGNNLQFAVDFGLPVISWETSLLILYGITAAVAVILIGLFVYYRAGRRQPNQMEKTDIIASVLNEDEKRLVDILRNAGGKAGQKVLVRESQFSKAKISRLIKTLKARNVVEIEPISGRENRVLLKTEVVGETKEEKAS